MKQDPPLLDNLIVREIVRALALLEKSFATGKDPGAVLQAIFICLQRDLPIPDWASGEFRRAYAKGSHGQLKSWDEVFGRPRTADQYRRWWQRVSVPQKVWGAVAEAKGRKVPIDDKLFEKIGRDLGLGGKTKVREFYKMWADFLGRRP
jgi:hypothetical protein